MNQPCSQIRNPNSVIRNSARRALPLALRSLLLFALCSLPFAFAAAQTNSATLSGTVADEKGAVIWINNQTVPYVAFSGKCPHLGCGYKWRSHKTRGQVFLCPCHLSIYDASGAVLDGPAPRPLDVLPIKVAASGDIEVIDVEYKAGKKEQVRIA